MLTIIPLDEMGFKDDVADLLFYLYNEGNLTDPDQFWTFLHHKFSPDIGEKVMTLGQRDKQQAEHRVLQETARRMLEKKLDITLISEITKLTPKEISQLAKKRN